MLILLFGSENWIVSGSILEQLESFLGELAKRALKWPRHPCRALLMNLAPSTLNLDQIVHVYTREHCGASVRKHQITAHRWRGM